MAKIGSKGLSMAKIGKTRLRQKKKRGEVFARGSSRWLTKWWSHATYAEISITVHWTWTWRGLPRRRRLIVLWFTPIIAEIIDNYPRWTFYTASVYTRDWPIFAWMFKITTLTGNLFCVRDDETNRCVICHIKCQRVNRIIGWKSRWTGVVAAKEHVSSQ